MMDSLNFIAVPTPTTTFSTRRRQRPQPQPHHHPIIIACACHSTPPSSEPPPSTPPQLLPIVSRRRLLQLCISLPALPAHASTTSISYDSYNYDKTAPTYEILDGTTALTKSVGLDTLRAILLSNARGSTVELGFGTGVNLPFYTNTTSITGVDASKPMLQYASSKKAIKTFVPIVSDATHTNLPSYSFDTVVATFCLCVVNDATAVANEMRRLVKHGGIALVLDYTRSDEYKSLAIYQDFTAGAVAKMSKGCVPNLQLTNIMTNAGFSVSSSTSILAGTVIALELTPV